MGCGGGALTMVFMRLMVRVSDQITGCGGGVAVEDGGCGDGVAVENGGRDGGVAAKGDRRKSIRVVVPVSGGGLAVIARGGSGC
ncbi:hypothetical protein Tco_0646566 [Tanacetum coccineum]